MTTITQIRIRDFDFLLTAGHFLCKSVISCIRFRKNGLEKYLFLFNSCAKNIFNICENQIASIKICNTFDDG